MLLELQIKYLRQMESFYVNHLFNPQECIACLGMCNRSFLIGGKKFKQIFIDEAFNYCQGNKLYNQPYRYAVFWFPLNKQGIRQRKLIIRAIRKRKEALLKECMY